MKKHGRKFAPREKERALLAWRERGGGRRIAGRIARLHDCAASSLYRWHDQYDGTLQSLANGDQTPHRIWNRHTAYDIDIVRETALKHPHADRNELLGWLRIEHGFARSIRTLYRIMQSLQIPTAVVPTEYKPKPYETPSMFGVKWQIDVKHVPAFCMININGACAKVWNAKSKRIKFYQYTCLDETTRKRFIYIYDHPTKHHTVDFFKRCIVFFGYKPLIVQTDNGGEFTNARQDYKLQRRAHPAPHIFDQLLASLGVEHKRIAPATPRHNGKVERSHLTDNRCFYCFQTFTSLADARDKAKEWLFRYNNVRPHSALGHITPQMAEDRLWGELLRANRHVSWRDIERVQKCGLRHITRHGVVGLVDKDEAWAFADRPLQSHAV